MATVSYANLHDHLKIEMGDEGNSEGSRLTRLRADRNLRHGPFLRESRFEKHFVQSRGIVPLDVVAISFLLVLGLVLSPEKFMFSDPN